MAFRLHTNMVNNCGRLMTFEFGGQCNYVGYTSDKFCVFKHEDEENKTTRTLMMVPYENILYIENVEENEDDK